MLVNIHHGNRREHVKLLVAGVVFITVMALLVALSIAIYNKAFTTVTMVTIKADRAGLQLTKLGDVRRNGVLVGQVREVSQDGEEASIRVALTPSAAKEIPANVEVQILPTTLFGQKFVSFVTPDDPADDPLRDGDVIPSERVEDQRRAEPDPRRAVPVAARRAPGRPQRHPQRARHRARGARRAARRDARPAGRLRRRDRG